MQPSDGDLVEAEERPMMQIAHKMMTAINKTDGRHRMLVAGLAMAVVIIASIEPALAYR